MSAVIGSLRATLGLDTAQFQEGLKRSQTQMQAWGSRMKSIAAIGAAAFAALAGGASVAIKANINLADKVGKLSQAAGVTTEELSTLAFAAELSGLSIDDLGNSIAKLGKGMSDALMTPTSQQALAFRAMGVSITDAGGQMRSQVDVMNDVADRFAGMRDGANKTALALAIFGRAGKAMIPLLNQGSAGINAMRQEARELGLELDKTTTMRAEQFNDTLTRIRKVFDGLVTRITAALLPALNQISGAFLDLVRDGSSFQVIADSVGWAMKHVARFGLDVVAVLKEIQIWSAAVSKATGQLFEGEFSAAFATLKDGRDKVEEVWASHADRVKKLWSSTAETLAEPIDAGTVLGSGHSMAAAQNSMKRIKEQAVAATSAFDELRREGERVFDATRTPVERLQAEIKRLNELMQAGVIDFETYRRAVSQAQDALGEAAESGNGFRDFIEGQATGWFDDIIDGTFRAKDALRGFAREAARIATNRLLMTLFDNLLGGGAKSGGGSFLSGMFGGFRAMGGDVQPGKAYVVGERQPEVFVPRQSGTILPSVPGGGGSLRVEVVNNSSQQVRAVPGERSADGAFQRIYLEDAMQGPVQTGLRKSAPGYGLRPQPVMR